MASQCTQDLPNMVCSAVPNVVDVGDVPVTVNLLQLALDVEECVDMGYGQGYL